MINNDITIEFISSSNKLRSFETDIKLENVLIENNETNEKTQSKIYKKHKIDGVAKCSQILEKNVEFKKWKHVLETKKKDDLADCFLQGIWYLHKNGYWI
jgi:hypothetical protein